MSVQGLVDSSKVQAGPEIHRPPFFSSSERRGFSLSAISLFTSLFTTKQNTETDVYLCVVLDMTNTATPAGSSIRFYSAK